MNSEQFFTKHMACIEVEPGDTKGTVRVTTDHLFMEEDLREAAEIFESLAQKLEQEKAAAKAEEERKNRTFTADDIKPGFVYWLHGSDKRTVAVAYGRLCALDDGYVSCMTAESPQYFAAWLNGQQSDGRPRATRTKVSA